MYVYAYHTLIRPLRPISSDLHSQQLALVPELTMQHWPLAYLASSMSKSTKIIAADMKEAALAAVITSDSNVLVHRTAALGATC